MENRARPRAEAPQSDILKQKIIIAFAFLLNLPS